MDQSGVPAETSHTLLKAALSAFAAFFGAAGTWGGAVFMKKRKLNTTWSHAQSELMKELLAEIKSLVTETKRLVEIAERHEEKTNKVWEEMLRSSSRKA